MVWYFHLFQDFPQFIVIHTVKGFGIDNKAEIDISLELSCFFGDPMDVGNLISGSSAFSKSSLYVKIVYCHPVYLTYMKSISCEMLGWMKHKLASRLLGEISVNPDMQ